MSVRADFDTFLGNFKLTKFWADMEQTHENSPFHREPSVAVHTQLLINWYYEHRYESRDPRQQLLSLVSCLWHDVAKPRAEVVKHSPERGEYRAYSGHDLLSARLWTNFALENKLFVREFTSFDLTDIANVALMIEHHVPFGLKNPQKRRNLKRALVLRLGEKGHQAWLDFLLADQHGRVSDDHPTKLEAVRVWLEEWEAIHV